MLVEQVLTGGDRNFGYLVADEATRAAALIDPSYDPDGLVERARARELDLRYILTTHDHYDHTEGTARARKLSGAQVVIHEAAAARADVPVRDGDTLALGALTIRVIHTPGHTLDSVCYLVADALFTGDTLFVGKVGGTSGERSARDQYESLHGKLLALPDGTRVLPGHDVGVQPTSTIGHERETNPFLLQRSFEEFYHLKNTWADYKREHGIA